MLEKKSKPTAYIPDNAKINIKNIEMSCPKTIYEQRKYIFPREQIKDKVTKRETP